MKTRWTKKRLEAVINAVTAMLAGEEGEGDWDPSHSAEDLQAGLQRLQEEREALDKPRKLLAQPDVNDLTRAEYLRLRGVDDK